jgi:drug/metabolite transporter (DMT)-like permease
MTSPSLELRIGPAAAAVAGSVMVGFLPLVTWQLYRDGVGPASLLLWRYTLALAVIGAASGIIRLDLRRAWREGAWRIALIGATLGAAQTLCWFESLRTLESSVAVLLFYTYPAMILVLDRLLFGQRIRPLAALCVAIILAGAALIAGPGVSAGAIDPGGLAWAVPAPLIYAFYLAAMARLMRGHPPLAGAAFLYIGLTATYAAVGIVAGVDIPATAASWAAIGFLAIGAGALSATLFSYSVPRLGPTSYAIIANTELVTVVVIGVALLGDRVTASRAFGAALIVAGITAHGLFRRQEPSPASLCSAPSPAMREREGPAAPAAGG